MLSNFITGLATVAITVSAWGNGSSGYGNYYSPYGGYGGYGGMSQYGGYSPYGPGPYGGYGHGGYQPWSKPQEPEKPEGWYSPYSQYSPPRIPYQPVALHESVYAICEFENFGTLELAQMSGYSIYVKGTLGPFETPNNILKINELGRLGIEDDRCSEENTGAEFNPLNEVDRHGNPNPYQDPARGRIVLTEPDASNEVVFEGTTKLLQNLAGYNSLIGRSMTLFDTTGEGESAVDCCTIGLMAGPEPAEPQHSHNYGGYYPGSRGGYKGWW